MRICGLSCLGAVCLLLFKIWIGWLPFAKESCGVLGFVLIFFQCHSLPAAVMCLSIVRLELCAIDFVMHITVISDRDRRITDSKRLLKFDLAEYLSIWLA